MAVTNAQASREVPRTDYTITADVDVNGELTPNDMNNFTTHTSTISVTIPDPSTINAGDTLTFYNEAFEFNVGDGTPVTLVDGTVIGTYSRTETQPSARDIQIGLKDGVASDSNNYSYYYTHVVTFNDAFSDPSKTWGEVSFDLTYRGWQAAGWADHERTTLASFKDSEGVVLDSIEFRAPKQILSDMGGVYENADRDPASNGLFNFTELQASYDMVSSNVTGLALGYGGNTRTIDTTARTPLLESLI